MKALWGIGVWLLPALALASPAADALTLLEDWQLEDAKAQAEELLALDPQDPENIYLAARVQHARGEHLSALSLTQGAITAGSSQAQDFLPLVEHSAHYQAAFATYETAHFRIHYLNKDEIVATYAAPVLEAAYKNIGTDLDFFAAERGEKIVVEIYPDARGLAGATGLTVREIETSGTIAVCKFHRLMITSPLATADGYAWADTMAHEFVHLLISKKSHNNVPIWLHEGIAKFFESRWRTKAGAALGPYSEKLLANAVRKKKFITYQQMHPSMAKLPSQEDAALAFAEVFTTIEYLTAEFGTPSVPKLLATLAKGVELQAALKQVYGMDLNGIEAAWRKYLLRRPFHEVAGAEPRVIKLAASGEGSSKEPRALEDIADRAAHDAARLGELLQLRGHAKAAVVEYEKAFAKAGVSYATLACRLAKAYMEVGRQGEAGKILDKVLVAHPDENDAHLLAGRLKLAAGDVPGATAHFEAVRLENPFNPEIHAALKALYEHQGSADKAAVEQHFLELSSRPRPSRKYELPAPRAGEARLNLVVSPFGRVNVAGSDLEAPVWDYAVPKGSFDIAFGKTHQKVDIGAGETRTVVLK